MPDLLKRCFAQQMQQPQWQQRLQEMIPSYGKSLSKDGLLVHNIRAYTSRVLGLEFPQLA